MKKAFNALCGSLSILAVFGLCLFMIVAGSDVLSNGYANCPAWLGWFMIGEGFACFIVFVINVINSVCYEN